MGLVLWVPVWAVGNGGVAAKIFGANGEAQLLRTSTG